MYASLLIVLQLAVFPAAVGDWLVCSHNVKTAMLIVNGFWVNQVSDFGLSISLKTDETGFRGGGLHNVLYCAPEVCLENEVSFASDVFSFGVILWEMYTARAPFAGMTENQIRVKKVCPHNA